MENNTEYKEDLTEGGEKILRGWFVLWWVADKVTE